MGRRRSFAPLNVFLNTRLVGQLLREKSGAISFAYDRSWLEWGHRMPISLSLPLRKDRFLGGEAIPVFDNLLPDNPTIRRRVAERVGAAGTDAFSLLSEIGRDCVGALQFLPDGEEPQPQDRLTGEPVDETQIEAILNDLDRTPLGIRRESEFRISVAGAQEKTALLFHDGQWIEPSGTTPTTHIIKPQIGRLPNGMDLSNSAENEYFCLKLMQGFGLRAADAEMATFGERKALVVERFDRLWTKDERLIRLPQEDMCQALSVPSTQKYQNEGGPGIVEIIDTLRGSDEPTQDRLDFFKANILFWLIGATDGHAKNFSIGLLPGGRFRLTPFYDVMTVQPTFDAGEIQRKDFRLAMRLGKSRHYRVVDIVGRHFQETGLQAGLSRQAIDDVFADIRATADAAIAATVADLPRDFPEEIATSVQAAIFKRLEQLTDKS
ncbi:toxin HipA [Rhodovulum sulfidophilum]|uniref:type II toxin-antitoxin system HipA family toxin n=1 Tax=Rhodovulum sulfidophilum TaxID=35806 RepID=UPI0019130FCA|nr:type II toxin-antitoxin system HipA family toxin [Rhodovulum sulfidophilum]MBK5923869.1 toxin HipA [Rhodovulum sulfidophilum]